MMHAMGTRNISDENRIDSKGRPMDGIVLTGLLVPEENVPAIAFRLCLAADGDRLTLLHRDGGQTEFAVCGRADDLRRHIQRGGVIPSRTSRAAASGASR